MWVPPSRRSLRPFLHRKKHDLTTLIFLQLARQRFVSRPLISQTGQLVADAVNCELCNCVLYDFTSKNGENIVQLHKESRESVEWGRENGVAGCWGCDD